MLNCICHSPSGSSCPSIIPEVEQDLFQHCRSHFSSTLSLGCCSSWRCEEDSPQCWSVLNVLSCLPSSTLDLDQMQVWFYLFGLLDSVLAQADRWEEEEMKLSNGHYGRKKTAHWFMLGARHIWMCWGNQPLPAKYCCALVEGVCVTAATSFFLFVLFFVAYFSSEFLGCLLFSRLNHRQVLAIQWMGRFCFPLSAQVPCVVEKCWDEWSSCF